MSRTTSAARTIEFEHMRIAQEGGRLVYTAKPSGQAEASFGSIEITESSVVFEDKTHDFPQRIIYRRQTDGSLLARIEGERGGEIKGFDFPMKRVECMAAPPD